jgi:cysteine-rich repeat protein
VCAAECERASDCPYDGRCENAACVPLPERASSDTADAASALDAGCVASECDAGTREDAASTCGDGILQPENSESCDDGNFVDGDGCASNCTVEDTDSCGDNLLQSFEACDDGNLVDGDGCSDNCAIEPGYTCAPSGAPCFSETP